ncbi:MAG: YfhO family protein, partial [Lachnospiraceae bacterium]|nr:YfhO family protein [Lachnospiraceae bacterium]
MLKKKLRSDPYALYTAIFIPAVFVIFFVFTFLIGGKSLINSDDGYHETYPALVFISRYVREFIPNLLKGRVIMYSPEIGMGEDPFSSLSWNGFGDIFNWGAVFFGPRYMWVYYGFITVLRLWLSGIGFIVFARVKNFGFKETVAGAVMYSLSGYALGNEMTYMSFQPPKVYFPFMAAGIMKVLEGGEDRRKWGLVTAAAFCLQGMCGYYFLYVNLLGGVIFFLIEAVPGMISRKWRPGYVAGRFGAIALWCTAGIGASLVYLMPPVIMTMNSTRTESMKSLSEIFSLPTADAAKKYFELMFLPKRGCYYFHGYALPVIVLLCLLFCLVFMRKYRLYKQTACYVTAFLCSFFPAFGTIANGFLYNTVRWVYLLHFMLAAVTASLIPYMAEQFGGKAGGGKTGPVITPQRLRSILCVFVIANILVLRFVEYAPRSLGGQELYGTFRRVSNIYEDLNESTFSTALASDDRRYSDTDFFRYDISNPVSNAGMLYGMPATTEDLSIVDPSSSRLSPAACLTVSGGGQGNQGFISLEGRTPLEALLSVRKYTDLVGAVPLSFDNPQALPMGIMFYDTVTEEETADLFPLTWMNVTTDRLILDKEDEGTGGADFSAYEAMTTEIPFEMEYEGNFSIEGGNEGVPGSSENTVLKYTGGPGLMKAAGGTVLHISFPPSEEALPLGTEYYVAIYGLEGAPQAFKVGEKYITTGGARPGDHLAMVKLFYEPQRGSFDMEFPGTEEDVFTFSDIKIFRNDNDALNTFAADRREGNSVTDYRWDGNRFSENVETEKEGWLFVSLPFNEGWKCCLDGAQTEIIRADNCYMAVRVSPGKHSVEFSYSTPHMGIWALISLIS